MNISDAIGSAMMPVGAIARPDFQRLPGAEEERPGPAGPVEETQDTEATTTEREGPQAVTELTPEEEQVVRELQQRDREVRAHEQAHIAAGGRYVTGGATYDFQTGPDGRRYAVGGEVSIDTSRPADPQEAIQKARVIHAAALAPADPSPQDHRVAAQARMMEAEAHAELRLQRQEEATAEGQPMANDQEEEANPMAARDRLAQRFAEVDQLPGEPLLRAVA
ncbi:SprA-related family protein [Ectothiorhodospira magna]|uniref:SprA-related family protein n=1 Tax=Ectothiorhodospira magna TaxID=867345 RepID=A0A1H9G821_9GAMM|nr:putative metalloprotease CJM1_0395 family protein [Ectothiorhodospira magna]SEQ45898.1 SprA-related family protein [Ectothiorhodospira magna]